jgi:pSer/pThr/pTyr-binding forkhead associated (FHA) protein
MSPYRLKGTSGTLINQSFGLAARLLIGSSDECDIRVDHQDVAPRQAEVLLQPDGAVVLRNLEPAQPVRVNGLKVTETRLAGGDEIQFGNHRLMLQAPGLRPERVLEGDAVKQRARRWPWLVGAGLAAALGWAWWSGYLQALFMA